MSIFAKAAAKQKQRPVQAKRILRQGDSFFCGLCHKKYETKADAVTCLKKCASDYLEKGTETSKAAPGSSARKFRCSFCQRVYPEKQAAIECAKACRVQAKSKLDAEKKFQERHLPPEKLKILESMSGGDEALDEARHQLGQKKKKSTGAGLFSKGTKKSAASSVFNKKTQDTSVEEPVVDQSTEEGEDIAAPEATNESTQGLSALQLEYLEKAQKINATKDNDKFVRDGARYVCRVCNERFFTKMEVVQCFDKHLDPVAEEDESA